MKNQSLLADFQILQTHLFLHAMIRLMILQTHAMLLQENFL